MDFASKHFTLEKLKGGIYAAIARPGGGAVGNAGFIDLGDQTLIFDTFNTQQAAEDLRFIAEKVTGRTASWAINSHWHGDHIRGNQAFKNSKILTSERTYRKMKAAHPERIRNHKEGLEDFKQYIRSLEDEFQQTQQKALGQQIQLFHEMVLSVPTLELTLPRYTFQNEFTFYGEKRTAQLKTLGGAHSICDAFLYIPEEKLVFMADLLFVQSHPSFFEDSDLEGWIRILEEIQQMEIEIAVPGHGVVGTKEDIAGVIAYIKNVKELAKESQPPGEVQMPSLYEDWEVPEVFKQNLRVLQA